MQVSACASPGKTEGGTGKPPPPKKKRRGEGEKARKQPTAAKPPASTTRGGQTPPPEGTEDRTPKEAEGDHPPKTGNTKPGTAANREKGHRNGKKKKESHQPSPKGRGWRDRDHKARDRKKKRKNKSAKNTPRQPSQEGLGTAETRAQHTRPHRTPEPETAGGQAGRPRNHTRPISRPEPKPNHEHHKQPTLEGQHHNPCPNTATQDPSQDWRG